MSISGDRHNAGGGHDVERVVASGGAETVDPEGPVASVSADEEIQVRAAEAPAYLRAAVVVVVSGVGDIRGIDARREHRQHRVQGVVGVRCADQIRHDVRARGEVERVEVVLVGGRDGTREVELVGMQRRREADRCRQEEHQGSQPAVLHLTCSIVGSRFVEFESLEAQSEALQHSSRIPQLVSQRGF